MGAIEGKKDEVYPNKIQVIKRFITGFLFAAAFIVL